VWLLSFARLVQVDRWSPDSDALLLLLLLTTTTTMLPPGGHRQQLSECKERGFAVSVVVTLVESDDGI
jgi:hypothetical protein